MANVQLQRRFLNKLSTADWKLPELRERLMMLVIVGIRTEEQLFFKEPCR